MPEYELYARDNDWPSRGVWYRVSSHGDTGSAEYAKSQFDRDSREQGLSRECEVRMSY